MFPLPTVSITCSFHVIYTLCFHYPPFPVLYRLPVVSITRAFHLNYHYTLFPLLTLSITCAWRSKFLYFSPAPFSFELSILPILISLSLLGVFFWLLLPLRPVVQFCYIVTNHSKTFVLPPMYFVYNNVFQFKSHSASLISHSIIIITLRGWH